MDERRKRDAEGLTQGQPAISLEPPVSPFGKSLWLGTALGIFSVVGAVWTVADRFFNRIALEAGGVNLLAVYQTLRTLLTSGVGALLMFILLLLAVKASQSLPDKAAFAGLALAELVQSIGMMGGLWLPQGDTSFYLAAVCVPLAGLARVAAYLVVFVNRENCRDARLAAFATGCVWIVRTIIAAVTYFAAWVVTGELYAPVWVDVLNAMSNVTLFAAILGGVGAALTFWLLRTPVPATTYPEKNEQK